MRPRSRTGRYSSCSRESGKVIRPVFTLPPAPERWGGSTSQLIRIVDPAGDAIAWLDPETAACVGYAVRESSSTSTSWRHVLVGGLTRPDDSNHPAAGRNIRTTWRLVERDPAACTLAGEPANDGAARLVLVTASLDDGNLSLAYRIPAPPSRTALSLTLACESPPLLQPNSSGRKLYDPHTSKGIVVISFDSCFISELTRTMASPDGAQISLVTLTLPPPPASASPGIVREHIVRIGMQPT